MERQLLAVAVGLKFVSTTYLSVNLRSYFNLAFKYLPPQKDTFLCYRQRVCSKLSSAFNKPIFETEVKGHTSTGNYNYQVL